MVVGLTDDSFGSLTVEQMQKFSDHFKVPEQFVKLGDKIVAIPMISKEQQKQESVEQKDFEMNAMSWTMFMSYNFIKFIESSIYRADELSFKLKEKERLLVKGIVE